MPAGSQAGRFQSMAAQRSTTDCALESMHAVTASLPHEHGAARVVSPPPLPAHAVGAGGEHDGCVLLVAQLPARSADPDMADVELVRNVAGEGVVAEQRHVTAVERVPMPGELAAP